MVRHAQAPETADEQVGEEPRSDGRKAIGVAGIFVLLAVAGPLADPLWLALLPAAAALALGTARMGRNAWARGDRVAGPSAGALCLSATLLVLLAGAGWGFQQASRLEPPLLTQMVKWAGWLFLASVMAFALAGMTSRLSPRGACVLLAMSLPLGLAVDMAAGGVTGFFLQGIGFSGALGLFGLSLVLISRRRPAGRPDASGR